MRYAKRDNVLPKDRTSGVYTITNTANGKVYVGSAVSLYGRLKAHRTALRYGEHPNKHLQAAWDKYGEAAFKFEVLVNCITVLIIRYEQEWIDNLKAADRRYGYNKCEVAYSVLGTKRTEEQKRRMSEAAKVNPKILAAAKKGNAASVLAVKGKPRSAAFKAKVSAGLKASEKAKAASKKNGLLGAAANKGKPRSDYVKKRIGESHKGKRKTPEQIAKIKTNHWSKRPDAARIIEQAAAKQRGRKHSEDHKQKITEGNLLRWQRHREAQAALAAPETSN